MDNKQFTLESFKNIQQLIVFLHNKANAVIVVDGFAITVFLSFSKDLIFISNYANLTLWHQTVSFLTFVSALTFIGLIIYQLHFVIFRIISPSLAKNYDRDHIALFYFEHIAGLEKKDFHKRTENLTDEAILDQLTGQVFEVAKILTTKTKRLRIALHLLFSSLIVLAVFAFLSRLL